jgi:hypothetical protein
MNQSMKPTTILRIAILVALTTVLISCKRDDAESAVPVVFPGSGITLAPGNGWEPVFTANLASATNICLPMLRGEGPLEGALIRVYLSDSSDVQARAATVQATLSKSPNVTEGSVKLRNFTTDSGLPGIRVSCDLDGEAGGRVYRARNYMYIVKNKQGACVAVTYDTMADKDSETIHRMILRTLRLE